METASKRPPGRPRSDAARRAILAATARLVVEDGYTATTIDAIAGAAGVGKQTIYRWWPTKADVVLDATAGSTELSVPVTDHGSYVADLRSFLTTAYEMAGRPVTQDVLRSLMVEAQLRPEFGDRFRATFLTPRRDAFARLVERARRRGDLPRGAEIELLTDIVFGTLWYRLLGTGGPLDAGLVDGLVDLLSRDVPAGPPAPDEPDRA